MTLAVAALPSMAKCAWPRPTVGETVVTHPATFAAKAATVTTPIPLAKALRPYRREAIAGINYAWGHGYVAPDDCDDAGRMEQPLPAHQRSEPAERKPLDLLSRNGKRLPLRALAWRDLNREFWSQGKVVYGDALERSQARELSAHEKRVEDMTLDELVATQDREPLSESRRSWLTRGAGVLSLEGVAYGEGSIGEMLAAKGSIGALATMDVPEEQTFADEASSIGNGVPYELLDPITAKQIEWEQRVYYDEPPVLVKIAAKSDGGLALATDRKLMPDAFMRLARSVKRTLLDSDSGWDATEHRFRMVDNAAARLGFASADANEERERYLAPADDEWHSSYEMPVAVIVHDGTGTPALFPCMRCNRPFVHRHERITRIVHRGTTRSKDELWRNRIFDITSFEMGTDGLVDPLVSF